MRCALCDREAKTTRHHLVPRSRRRRERDAFGSTADLCRDCHRAIHATFANERLSRELNSVERLRVAPELESYLKWIRRRPASSYFGARDRNA